MILDNRKWFLLQVILLKGKKYFKGFFFIQENYQDLEILVNLCGMGGKCYRREVVSLQFTDCGLAGCDTLYLGCGY
jgi:hypothetical protein